jgi:hypothetical protein
MVLVIRENKLLVWKFGWRENGQVSGYSLEKREWIDGWLKEDEGCQLLDGFAVVFGDDDVVFQVVIIEDYDD